MAYYLNNRCHKGAIMIKHYLKMGVRNLLKYKTQSIICIIGLSIGLTFFTIGYHWYNYETSYDSFYPESDDTYNVYTIDKQTGKKLPGGPYILSTVLNEDFPEVKHCAILNGGNNSYTCDGKTIGQPHFKWVNQKFVKLFPPQVIAGNVLDPIPTTDSYSATNLMVTRKFARKFWKTPEDAIGKTLTDKYNNKTTITAVIENPPSNTVFKEDGYYSILIEKSTYSDRTPQFYWDYPPTLTYLSLNKNVDVDTFRKKLRTYAIDNHLNPNLYIEIVPITRARYAFGSEISFNINYIRTFVLSGLLLLFCALFNFVNLQVNRFFERSREFKLRTSMGAMKKNLYLQMTTEISIQVLIALVVCLLLIDVFTPSVEDILETVISKKELFAELILVGISGWFLLLLIIFIFISRFIYRLADSVKTGKEVRSTGREWIQKFNIGLQLVICVGFMFTALVVFLQVDRMKKTRMGFDKDDLIQVNLSDKIYKQFEDEIKKLPMLKQVIRGGNFCLSHENIHSEKEIGWDDKPSNQNYEIQMIGAGIDFAQNMGIPLIKGRYLVESDQLDDDSGIPCRKILINEQMEELLGFDNPVGKTITRKDYILRGEDKQGQINYEIVGVVKDFHGLSLRNPIAPVIIEYYGFYGHYLYLRTHPGKEKEALKAVREVITRISPEGSEPSLVMTVNDRLNELNRTENASLRLFTLLAALCILISVFGIYSISSLQMQRRKKEIAIRKVAGASSLDIVSMFFRKYTLLVLGANAITLPVAFAFVRNWLEQYPDRITLDGWLFMIIPLITILLVVLTVCSLVVKATIENPVDSIRGN